MTSAYQFVIAGVAGIGAGIVNALAGGGTLITFPALTAIGIPAVAANVTNAVALCPGFLGGISAQSKDLKGQKKRLLLLLPAALLGGLIGGFILLATEERTFRTLVPYLILLASVLLALQDSVKKIILRRLANPADASPAWKFLPVAAAAIYGGYFGAGLGVILLSVLGLTNDDSLTRLNACKQSLAFCANFAAALIFIFSGKVLWLTAAAMAFGALFGGYLGGLLAGRIKASTLKWLVVSAGITISIFYFIK